MGDIFSLIFSPSGTVGRAGWWIMRIIYFIISIGLILWGVAIAVQVTGVSSIQQLWDLAQSSQKLAPAQQAAQWAQYNAKIPAAQVLGLSLGFLLLAWMTVVLDIKRWHDRGMSGFMVLLPALGGIAQAVFGPKIGGVVAAIIDLYVLVQLGFLGSADGRPAARLPSNPVAAAMDPKNKSKKPMNWQSHIGTVVVLGVAAFIGYLIVTGHSSSPSETTPATSTATASGASTAPPSAKASPPDTTTAQTSVDPFAGILKHLHPKSADDASYHGTIDVNFTKDSVLVGGTQLNEITDVVPMPKARVRILYSGGEKIVAANTLPQGFLDAWGMTGSVLSNADAK